MSAFASVLIFFFGEIHMQHLAGMYVCVYVCVCDHFVFKFDKFFLLLFVRACVCLVDLVGFWSLFEL